MDRLELTEQRRKFDEYLESTKQIIRFAKDFGIDDPLADSNLKQLQQAVYLRLTFLPERLSYDAIDGHGDYWELKSLNINNRDKVFSTSNPLTSNIIARYRNCNFAFSVYDNTDLIEIWVMPCQYLEPYFSRWEEKLKTKGKLNNPKIHLNYVKRWGKKIYDSSISEDVYDPTSILSHYNALPAAAWIPEACIGEMERKYANQL